FVDEMRVCLVQRDLGVGGGRRRQHRLVEAVGEDDVAVACVDSGEPHLLRLDGGRLPYLELGDVMLAPRLLVASEDIERLAAQIVKLRIAGVILEMMSALERGDRV